MDETIANPSVVYEQADGSTVFVQKRQGGFFVVIVNEDGHIHHANLQSGDLNNLNAGTYGWSERWRKVTDGLMDGKQPPKVEFK